MSDKLTPKEMMFAAIYSQCYNATLAARKAGYSSVSAGTLGSRLLQKVEVKTEVKRRMNLQLSKIGVNEKDIITEMARIGMFDPAKCFDKRGNLKPIKKMPKAVRAGIASIEVVDTNTGGKDDITLYTKKVKFYDKTKSLKMLADYLDLFPDGSDGKGIKNQYNTIIKVEMTE